MRAENSQYGLPTFFTPREAFCKFIELYGGWVQSRAWGISQSKGVDEEDVRQSLLLEAWIAATDSRYNPQGKTIIGFIHQRVVWKILKMYKVKNLESFLAEGYNFEDEDEGSEEVGLDLWESGREVSKAGYGCSVFKGDVMFGSRSLGRTADHLEIKSLIEKIIELLQELPSKFAEPILEILQPSKDFQQFLEGRSTMNEFGYQNAVRFETCTSDDLIDFTGSSIRNIEATIIWLKKKIPELKDL